jgi:glycopeptide antibiotics resistance protein
MFLINGSLIILLTIICYVVVRSFFIGRKYRNNIQVHWLQEMIKFLFVIYISLVISVTLFPLPIGFHYEYDNLFRSINLVPLATIINNISQIGTAYDGDVFFMISLIVRNVGGNVLLLMPLGFLAPIVWNKAKGLKAATLLGLGVSITIELLQLLESFGGGWGRVTDIDDVICNVVGAIIGYLIYVLIIKTGDKYKIRVINHLNT